RFDLRPHLERSEISPIQDRTIPGYAAFAPDGRLLAVPCPAGVVLIDTENGKRKEVLGKEWGSFGWTVTFSADSSTLGSFPIDKWRYRADVPIFVRGILSGKEATGLTLPVAPRTPGFEQPSPVSGALSPDGRRVVVAAPLYLWDLGHYVTLLTGWDVLTGKK